VQELSAYILTHHNEKGDHRVNCANFLVNFFRNGFQEKSRRLKALFLEKAQSQAEQEKLIQESQKRMQQQNALLVDFTFNEEDKKSAMHKLRNAAKLYDKTAPNALSMKAFEVKQMAPHVFKEQLKRIFNLQVNSAEMGALMAYFNGKFLYRNRPLQCCSLTYNIGAVTHVAIVNEDGLISCEEFSRVFLSMGFEEREKELRQSHAQQQEKAEHDRQQALAIQNSLANKNAMKVAYNYTDEEWESAMFKLKKAAWG
jgi:hypothetical protein